MTPRIKNLVADLPEIITHIHSVDKVLDAAYELLEDLRLNAALTQGQHDRIKTMMIRMEQF